MTYEEFAATQLRPLLRYATMLTGDGHLAADLVQEVMVKVQLHWRKVAAADIPALYVRRMVTNAHVDWRRGSWWRRTVLSGSPADLRTVTTATATADHADQSADRDRVWTLLRTLPRQQRAALVLRFYEDLSDSDIAEVLDCATGTVRSHISRGLATLRSAITADHSRNPMEART